MLHMVYCPYLITALGGQYAERCVLVLKRVTHRLAPDRQGSGIGNVV